MSSVMQQYQAVKSESPPDSLAIILVGDFYEAFGDDARTIAKELNLTLTTMTRNETTPMVGFPHHQLERYLGKLIARKHRVAIGHYSPAHP